jgi:predicted TPR repeat methyltransferase
MEVEEFMGELEGSATGCGTVVRPGCGKGLAGEAIRSKADAMRSNSCSIRNKESSTGTQKSSYFSFNNSN